MRQAFGETGRIEMGIEPVLGVLSVVFWSPGILVILKYLALVMRADNHGEGGVLSLVLLLLNRVHLASTHRSLVIALAMTGLALFYGDGLITPAISVLSAVEGLEIAMPGLSSAAVPISLTLLIGLFALQHRGTFKVGRLFRPVMCVWFASIGAMGFLQILREPSVLAALDPIHAVLLFAAEGFGAFVVLGAVVLAITGAEALYADMGISAVDPSALPGPGSSFRCCCSTIWDKARC